MSVLVLCKHPKLLKRVEAIFGVGTLAIPNDGEIGSFDYREKAPMAATRDMYLDEEGNVTPNKSTLGALAVGVPGTVAGLFMIHKKFTQKLKLFYCM